MACGCGKKKLKPSAVIAAAQATKQASGPATWTGKPEKAAG